MTKLKENEALGGYQPQREDKQMTRLSPSASPAKYQQSHQQKSLKSTEGHTLTMTGRYSLRVTGVDSVISFDEKEIHLETVEGPFIIVGEDLGIKNLNLEQAQLDIEGLIHVLSYLDGSGRARRKKIWEKLFR